MIFSIADLQSSEENLEVNEGDESAPADAEATYPLRCSFTITKVRTTSALHPSSSDKQHVAICPWRNEHRCRVSRGRVRTRERVVLQGC